MDVDRGNIWRHFWNTVVFPGYYALHNSGHVGYWQMDAIWWHHRAFLGVIEHLTNFSPHLLFFSHNQFAGHRTAVNRASWLTRQNTLLQHLNRMVMGDWAAEAIMRLWAPPKLAVTAIHRTIFRLLLFTIKYEFCACWWLKVAWGCYGTLMMPFARSGVDFGGDFCGQGRQRRNGP